MNIVKSGGRWQVYGEDVSTYKELPALTYTVGFHKQMGFWLNTHPALETNEEVIYGKHQARVSKILKSFASVDRNFGVILSGKKGIGKSLLARMLADAGMKSGYPVIIVDTAIPGISTFLASIDQEVIIIFDEFEKVFAKSDDYDPQVELLSLFDGLDGGKKLFVITCNSVRNLNDFFVNRPGRFHYHFEITAPTYDEVKAYMTDKMGTGYEEDIEKVARLSQTTDITYDCLRAIVFDLKQGYPLEDSLQDLNISYEREMRFDVTLRLSNGWTLTQYDCLIHINDRGEKWLYFSKDRVFLNVHFNPNDMALTNGVLAVPPEKINLSIDDDSCDNLPDDQQEAMVKKFKDEVTIDSMTFSKCISVETRKYLV